MGGGGGGGFQNENVITISGQKRGYPFSERGRSPPERFDGSGFAKLFVGSVPRTATEEDIRPLFMEHGNVLEVALIKDKRTGLQSGCCFVKYATSEEADRAIRGLHNQRTLPGGLGPIQVRYADGERERLGAVEYKLFVGSMNKQATEKEIEEVFAPYGRVEDVYLMRDEFKQSRGCGFVKFYNREMAMAAINGLNGLYTMQGCDQPLTVRFAEPKRPRPGESSYRGGPAFGGSGFGPRFEQPGLRPPPNLGGPISSNAWHPGVGPSSNPEVQGFGNQFPRPGNAAMPPNLGGHNGPTDGLRPGLGLSTSMPQQSFTPSMQVNSAGQQQISPLQQPVQSPADLSSSLQLRPQIPSSGPMNTLQGPPSSGQIPSNQVLPSQQYLGVQPQAQQNFSPFQAAANNNIQPQNPSGVANQQVMPPQQTSSQLVQMLSQQKQSLQASFQSSQQAFSQIRQQYQQIQPSLQNLMPQQSSQTTTQQYPWGGVVQSAVASTPANSAAADVPPAKPAATTGTAQTVAPAKCSWTEHTSPDGFKYYYNSATQQSTWEKPEELTKFEQQQQKQSVQQSQAQSYPQNLPTQQVQFQQQYRPPQQFPQISVPPQYQASGIGSQQNVQDLGYRQMPVAAGSANDPARFQQGGLQTNQEWMWKNNNS